MAAASFYRRFFACHTTHGSVDMAQALAQSCNSYFYRLGQALGIDLIHKWATALGLGRMSGIDLPHEVQGLIPSRAWKRAAHGERWYPGETISVAIGQGQVSVTPLSMAVMMAAVANGGQVRTPRGAPAVVSRPARSGRSGGGRSGGGRAACARDARHGAARTLDGGQRYGKPLGARACRDAT